MLYTIRLKLFLKLLIINTTLLHLPISQQVQHRFKPILLNQRCILTISWIRSNTHISLRQLGKVESLQEISIASFSYTINDEHLLGVPLLVVVRVLPIVVRWVDEADCSGEFSFGEAAGDATTTFVDGVVVVEAEMVVDYRLFLLFERDGGFEWHDALAVFAMEPVLLDNRPRHYHWLITLTPVTKFISTTRDINLILETFNWCIYREINLKAFPNVIKLNNFVLSICFNAILDTTSIDLR